MPLIIAFVAGVMFGAGLTIAQMVDPLKVLNFLDVAAIRSGGWDPTLLFVFAGALPVMFAAYRVQRRLAKPAFGESFQIPTHRDIDTSLVVGSALFGIGWGLIGICPGPAIAALALARSELPMLALFIAAMLAGMALAQVARR